MNIFDFIAFTIQGRLQPVWILGGIALLGFLWAFMRLVKYKTKSL